MSKKRGRSDRIEEAFTAAADVCVWLGLAASVFRHFAHSQRWRDVGSRSSSSSSLHNKDILGRGREKKLQHSAEIPFSESRRVRF